MHLVGPGENRLPPARSGARHQAGGEALRQERSAAASAGHAEAHRQQVSYFIASRFKLRAVWCSTVRYSFSRLGFPLVWRLGFVAGARALVTSPLRPLTGRFRCTLVCSTPYTDGRYERHRTPSSLATSPPPLGRGERTAIRAPVR